MTAVKGSEALMRILLGEGVEYVFGLPGSTEIRFMDALEDHPELKYVLGLHECIAAGMAVGYSRASGKVSVLNFHTYAGIGAAMGPLLDAYKSRVPLIVTAGQPDRTASIQERGLTADLVALGRPFSKWSAEVASATDLPLMMRRAFKVVGQPPVRPVFISLPQNVMDETVDFAYTPGSASTFSRRRPDKETVAKAAGLLAGARQPVMVLGAVVAEYRAVPEVVELAELIGAEVYVPPMGGDIVFPTGHQQFLGALNTAGADAARLFTAADAAIAIGVQLPPSAGNVIQLDNDPWEMGKNWPVFAGLEGDIRLSLIDLNEAVRGRLSPEDRRAVPDRIREIAGKKAALAKKMSVDNPGKDGGSGISAHHLGRELAAVRRPDGVLVDESWSYSTVIQSYLDFTGPNSYIRGRGPSIGQGMPLAIGAKLALPDREVIALVGDGSAMWSCQSLWTAVRYRVPVKFVVLHNASYRLVKLNKIIQMGEGVRGRYLGLDLDAPKVDFCRLAEAMGVRGRRVERPEDLNEALKAALDSAGPELVEVMMDGEV
jgi:benzoylformate decarboxylase